MWVSVLIAMVFSQGVPVKLAWPFLEPDWQRPGAQSPAHTGDDLYAQDWVLSGATAQGRIVLAPVAGVVVQSEWTCSSYGKTVTIWDETRQLAVRFAHLDDVLVVKGAVVRIGDRKLETQSIREETSDPDTVTRVNGRAYSSDGHPIDSAARQARSIKVRAAYRIVLGQTSLIYVSADREYRRPSTFNDAGCNAVSTLRAWLRVDAKGAATVVAPTMSLNDCDMKGDEFVSPLGVLLMDGVPHVIVEIDGWESQEVGVIRVTNTAARIVARAPTR